MTIKLIVARTFGNKSDLQVKTNKFLVNLPLLLEILLLLCVNLPLLLDILLLLRVDMPLLHVDLFLLRVDMPLLLDILLLLHVNLYLLRVDIPLLLDIFRIFVCLLFMVKQFKTHSSRFVMANPLFRAFSNKLQ
jgi:hypothetical protein